MPEYTELTQTLEEALIAEGNQAQADLLTQKGKALTRDQIIDIINHVSWDDLDSDTLKSLRKISVIRIKSGQPVFPWNDQEFLDEILDDLPHEFIY